jgi:type VI secretion system secreted protein Hcp
MFLQLDDVKGEAVYKQHENQIDVLAWRWESNAEPDENSATIGRISITKYVDASSPALLEALLTKRSFPNGQLTIRRVDPKKTKALTITLDNVRITRVSGGASSGEYRLVEEIELHFESFSLSCVPLEEDGTPGNPIKTHWKSQKRVR